MQLSIDKELVWHAPQWETLRTAGLERIPHALLLSGVEGVGKRHFGEQLAAWMLCEQAGNRPLACGQCTSCHWLAADTHPDLRRVDGEAEDDDSEASEAAGKKKAARPGIKIAAIRALENFVFIGSHRHGRRVVLIKEVELMNAAAANAVLKILEEPPAGVYFILTSSHPHRLLPTIRSRCRRLDFHGPTRADGETWLRSAGADSRAAPFLPVAGNAPLRVLEWQDKGVLAWLDDVLSALQRANEPLALARTWDELVKRESQCDLEMLVEAVQRWLVDCALAACRQAPRFHLRWSLAPEGLAPLETVTRGWRELLRFRRSARHPLNQQLFLEEFAVFALHALREAKRRAA